MNHDLNDDHGLNSGNDSPSDWDDSFEDSVNGGVGEDNLSGGSSEDLMHGGRSDNDPDDSDDSIYGHGGHDRIYGNGGDDSMFGGGGNDEVYGHDGADLLCGGQGTDTMTGGAGNDIFLILKNSGANELVMDFDDNGTDVISIERTATIQDFSDIQEHLVSDAHGSYIDLGNGSGLLLAGVLAGELNSSDFYFWG